MVKEELHFKMLIYALTSWCICSSFSLPVFFFFQSQSSQLFGTTKGRTVLCGGTQKRTFYGSVSAYSKLDNHCSVHLDWSHGLQWDSIVPWYPISFAVEPYSVRRHFCHSTFISSIIVALLRQLAWWLA